MFIVLQTWPAGAIGTRIKTQTTTDGSPNHSHQFDRRCEFRSEVIHRINRSWSRSRVVEVVLPVLSPSGRNRGRVAGNLGSRVDSDSISISLWYTSVDSDLLYSCTQRPAKVVARPSKRPFSPTATHLKVFIIHGSHRLVALAQQLNRSTRCARSRARGLCADVLEIPMLFAMREKRRRPVDRLLVHSVRVTHPLLPELT